MFDDRAKKGGNRLPLESSMIYQKEPVLQSTKNMNTDLLTCVLGFFRSMLKIFLSSRLCTHDTALYLKYC